MKLPLHIRLKLQKVIAGRIAECERMKQKDPRNKRGYWEQELADCDTLMRWMDAQGTEEITRPKAGQPLDLFGEIIAGHFPGVKR